MTSPTCFDNCIAFALVSVEVSGYEEVVRTDTVDVFMWRRREFTSILHRARNALTYTRRKVDMRRLMLPKSIYTKMCVLLSG